MRLVSVRQCVDALKLINRHALLLGPLLALTFAIIAGSFATDYGAQYLFRDNQALDYLGRCPYTYLCLFQSARFHSALYATALMGLVWTLFVLIESWDCDATERHPVGKVETVLPGVMLLGLVMVAAALFNVDDPPRYGTVLALSLLGYLAGLVFVAIVTKLGLLFSRSLRVHQMWTFLALGTAISIGASFLPVVTPSKAIFIALASVVIVYCAFEIAKAHYRFPLVVLIAGALALGSLVPNFKYEFRGLEAYYAAWPEVSAQGQPAPLLDPERALAAWLKRQPADAGPPKLVIVATSGGAYRATFWTAIVLDRLASEPRLAHFGGAVRLMTGASGGMVGAGYFAAMRKASGPSGAAGATPGVEQQLIADLAARRQTFALANSPTDSLTPVVRRLIGLDTLYAVWPTRNPADRGQVLEDEWPTLHVSFRDLEAGEAAGWRPSLIVSPYMVDSAQPLFISNLDLARVVKPEFALEFFKSFPLAHDRFQLATAARMNATFPFISPAVRLPLKNRSRVVDAGYFDNFGIAAAATFLRSDGVRRFIDDNKLEVILIRILAYPEVAATDPGHEPFWLQLTQIVEQIVSPVEGELAARGSRGRFVNDLLLDDLRRLYPQHFHEFKFVNPGDASFSWHIQTADIAQMKAAMASGANNQELDRLAALWTRKANP
jgi:hypothetical protein